MRILIAHSSYRIAGGEDSYVNEQIHLLEPRHDIHVLRPENTSLKEGARAALQMGYSRAMVSAVAEEIDRFRPDVVHVHNVYPSLGPAVHLAARRASVPLVMTIHNLRLRCPNGYMFTEGKVCRRCQSGNYTNALLHHCFPSKKQAVAYASILWAHRFGLKLEDKVDRWIVHSAFMSARLQEWGIPTERIAVIPHWVPLRTQAGSGSYGIFVGRLSSEKGVDVLLQALASAGDPPFLFVGDGPLRSRLERLARTLALEHCEFRGAVSKSEVMRLMSQAVLLVSPSLSEETGGLAALEAMSMGLPVVVSKLGALPELVEGWPQLIVPSGAPDDLAATLKMLLDDLPGSRRIGVALRERVKTKYTAEAHVNDLEACYQAALSSAAGPKETAV